jgi:hypothetical protein
MEKLLLSVFSVPRMTPTKVEGMGGEYKLTFQHSKTGTFSITEGLMDELKTSEKHPPSLVLTIIHQQ